MSCRGYFSPKFSTVKWLSSNRENSDKVATRFFAAGSCDQEKNELSIWTVANEDGKNSISNLFEINIGASARKIVSLEKHLFVASMNDDGFGLFNFSPDIPEGIVMKNFVQLDSDEQHNSTDILVRNYDEILSCGEDGRILSVNLKTRSTRFTDPLDSSSILCMDQLSAHEIIFGTRFGFMKLLDTRTNKAEMKINATQYGSTTAIQRNSHIPHYIASGSDSGTLYIWDLRNTENCQVRQLATHTGTISKIQYSDTEPNLLYTASYDGQVCKWDIGNNFKVKSVHSIVDRCSALPINSFDLNSANELIAACDFELFFVDK